MSDKPTRAEVLAEYLGLNEKARPELYTASHTCGHCKAVVLSRSYSCQNCGGGASRFVATYTLTLPDPLAPGTAADEWLGVLARWEGFWCLHGFVNDFGAEVFRDGFRGSFSGKENDPTPAIVRAMMAADSAFREKMEGAEG